MRQNDRIFLLTVASMIGVVFLFPLLKSMATALLRVHLDEAGVLALILLLILQAAIFSLAVHQTKK